MGNMEPPTRILQASVDEDDESEFRVLIDGSFIKYITIPAGILATDDMCFSPTFMSLIPSFPPGNWNLASISRDSKSGQLFFENVQERALLGVTSIWHASKIDYLSLKLGYKWTSGVYETMLQPSTEHKSIVKFARFEWEVARIDHETAVYEWIDGKDIGPAFQGHVTEHGRVIGFVIEMVPGARRADPGDLELCQMALAKLHALGIKHGDVNRHNFLIHNGRATLIDFDGAMKCTNRDELRREMQSLVAELEDTSGRGGKIAVPGQV